MSLSRRRFLRFASALPLAGKADALPDRPLARPVSLCANDASRLDLTPIARRAILDERTDEQRIARLRGLLAETAPDRPLAISGAMHSMGGQCLPRHGILASLPRGLIEIDQLDAFIARKRHVDPELKLRNALWDRYMA